MSASRVLHAIAARRPPLLLSKLRMLLHYRAFTRKPVEAVRYLLLDTELDNFTYEIGNLDELASFLADGLGVEQAVASSYLDELQGDEVLRRELTERLRGRFGERARVAYGRRLGWYAAVRIRKPRVAVQTGTHHGLGSAVLLSALARNAAEGEEGVLLDLDVRADTGWLVPERLESYRERHVGDPREHRPLVVGEVEPVERGGRRRGALCGGAGVRVVAHVPHPRSGGCAGHPVLTRLTSPASGRTGR